MSVLKQLAGQTVIYGISNILPRVLNFLVFTFYLTYKFDNQYDFGVYLELYAYSTIILVFLVYRMDTAFFRFGNKAETKEQAYSTAIIPLFFTVIISVVLMFTFHQELASFIDYDNKSIYIKWFAMILGFDALVALPYAKMRLDEQPKKFLFYRLLNVFLTVGLVMFFLEIAPRMGLSSFVNTFYQTDTPLDYVFLSNLIASGVVFLFMIPEFLKVKIEFDSVLWKKMFWYSLPLVLVGIAASINQAFATPIQKYFLGADQVLNLTKAGIYGAAAKMAILLNLYTVAFNYAAEPFFFNNADKKDSKKTYGLVALAFTITACFVILGIISYMDIVSNILGPNYRAALPVVPILLFAYLFLGLYYNFSIWYKLDDKTYWGAIISLIGAIITLVISISYLPSMGYVASAWAALACYGVMCLLGYLTGKKYYPIEYPVVKIITYIILTLILVVMLNYLEMFELSYILELVIKTTVLIGFISFAWVQDGKNLLA